VVRSDQYHEDYPHRPGKTPRPSLCTQCRFYRKARLVNRARDGSNRRWVTKYEARVDEREWCTHCGTLRSNKYRTLNPHSIFFPLTASCISWWLPMPPAWKEIADIVGQMRSFCPASCPPGARFAASVC
jgi:ferredoxin